MARGRTCRHVALSLQMAGTKPRTTGRVTLDPLGHIPGPTAVNMPGPCDAISCGTKQNKIPPCATPRVAGKRKKQASSEALILSATFWNKTHPSLSNGLKDPM